ncbi:hypothetical protein ACXYUJ_20060 [Escherichia coli]|uniref:hypothetical protein n=1 Tax=Escherichia coli TaxID=562 RepID=UPI001FFF4BC1|nr:hypothetical protein [Escherichia coli]ELS5808513.1 hypothetical protein [Escherichia coli]EMD3354122.1 hypothetical protein [Escherichia coli]MDE8176119.1 hypothetical protein [Escherichia coli]HCO5970214.1 hypothetical protein [Escherichia coli]HCT7268345.1 hypothetical protein [Escherichia coli]
MQISAQKAIEYGFVCDRNNNRITTDHSNKSSVDLSIREILFKDEKNQVRSLGRTLLKPQDSAFVISEEILHVPEGFIAYVFLKNRLSQKGFLALNTGIIDSGYNGPISTLLINFSAVEEYLPITELLIASKINLSLELCFTKLKTIQIINRFLLHLVLMMLQINIIHIGLTVFQI